MKTPRSASSSFSGGALILVAIGVLLLLGNLNVFVPKNFVHMLLTYWPSLFIALGITRLYSAKDASRGQGVALLALGLLLQLSMLDLWPGGLGASLSAAFLLLGLWLLLGPSKPRGPGVKILDEHAADIDAMAMLARYRLTSQQLECCAVSATFSDVSLHFDDARPHAEGATVTVDLLLASVKMHVPAGWTVTLEAGTKLGTVGDNRSARARAEAVPSGHMLVRGSVTLATLELADPIPSQSSASAV